MPMQFHVPMPTAAAVPAADVSIPGMREICDEMQTCRTEIQQLYRRRHAVFFHSSTKTHQFDVQIAKATQRLHDLKIIWNTLIPVGRLPPEILLEIFDLFRRKTEPIVGNEEEAEGYFDINDFDWYFDECLRPILHTCNRWRAVSRGCTKLWDQVHLSWPPHVIDWMIERGGDGPLRVLATKYRLCEEEEEGDSTLLLDHTVALRLTEIGRPDCIFPASRIPLIARLSDGSLRRGLKTVAVTFAAHERALPTGLMHKLLRASRDTLEHISLSSCVVKWETTSCFTKLRFLSLQQTAFPDGCTIQGLLAEIAEACPALRALTLTDLGISSQLTPQPATKIHFPSLRYVGLNLVLRQMKSVLAAVEFPPTCRPSLVCTGIGGELEEWLKLLQTHLGGNGFRHPSSAHKPQHVIQTAYITMYCSRLRIIGFNTIHDTFPDIDEDVEPDWSWFRWWPNMDISFGAPLGAGTLVAVPKSVVKVISFLPAADIQVLCFGLSGLNDNTGNQLRSYLAPFTGVTKLRIYDWKGYSLDSSLPRAVLRALTPLQSQAAEDSRVALVCPRLRWLELAEVQDTYADSLVRLSALHRLIFDRRNAGVPLEHLFITSDTAARGKLPRCTRRTVDVLDDDGGDYYYWDIKPREWEP